MKWNKYPDNPPSKKKEYLVVKNIFDLFQKIDVCAYSKNLYTVDKFAFPEEKRPGWYDYDSEYGYYEITNITHWTELPPMPRKDKE